ncbi:Protein-tyrosine kinase [Desulfovibrio sp. DV]|uniref:XrtA-associated tyrosine autokinase n=1 Tax=Desulfovibrio sp. DV TaxID=1844708 RepID=UPI00094BC1AE|nr:XrtA-associated tyrosine autokinase [Desulfovibrio sp. DV]OLN29428.1 Protein-tyrosine kinase [Desulfovibrio sp. DV]
MGRIEEALEKAVRRIVPDTPPPPLRADDNTPSTPPANMDPEQVTDERLVVIKRPHSPEAEEFRKLKEALFKEIKRRETFGNVILITSAGPREGKSLVTLNLAVSLAQEHDHTVLVIDADLRKPSCHRPFGIEVAPGLSDYLTDNLPLSRVMVRSGVGNLVILPAGKQITTPCELFSSNTMRQMIQEIKHRYPDRIILIDSPPILSFAETRILADQADATILVVREKLCTLESIQECLKLLQNKIIGIAYNGSTVQYNHQNGYNYEYDKN